MVELLLMWLAALLAPAGFGADAVGAAGGCGADCQRPRPQSTFAWQLQGSVEPTAIDADVVDVDAVETPGATVRALQRSGAYVVCYVNAGAWERWREDADDYPRELLGSELDGWPGERWLDVRDARLRPILQRRIAACARKGFDGIEFDNVDAYANDSGFDLTGSDQMRFNRWLADAAHTHGLAAALKNDPEQVDQLVGSFDFAVVEQCFQYDECEAFVPFVEAGKPVFVAEYELDLDEFCDQARRLRFSAARFPLDLDGPSSRCPWPR